MRSISSSGFKYFPTIYPKQFRKKYEINLILLHVNLSFVAFSPFWGFTTMVFGTRPPPIG